MPCGGELKGRSVAKSGSKANAKNVCFEAHSTDEEFYAQVDE